MKLTTQSTGNVIDTRADLASPRAQRVLASILAVLERRPMPWVTVVDHERETRVLTRGKHETQK